MKGQRLRWRREVLCLAILAMDATWLTPWLAMLTGTTVDPARRVPLPAVLALLLGAFYLARLLQAGRLPLAVQQLLAGALAVVTGLLLVGRFLYPGQPLLGLGWLPAWLGQLAHLRGYGPPGVVLMVLALYTWGRGIALAQNRLGVEPVGFYLRWGIVAWLFFYLLGLLLEADAPLEWLLAFFALGLLAVGLARVEEVHQERGVVRSPFATSWFLLMAASALGTVGLGLMATRVLSRGLVIRLWQALSPLGLLLQWALTALAGLIAVVASPLLDWLARIMAPVLERLANVRVPQPAATPMPALQPRGIPVPVRATGWVVAGMAFVAVVLLVVTILRRREEAGDEGWGEREVAWEAAGGEEDEGSGKPLQRLRRRLARSLQGLRILGYPLGSVREIYASLQRLASQRGLARGGAETPYEYERRLEDTWTAAQPELASLTQAYVLAHYGERDARPDELHALRAAWQRLRELVEGPDRPAGPWGPSRSRPR